MIQNHLCKNNTRHTSPFWSDDEYVDESGEQYSYCAFDGMKTRTVWVINYVNNEDFSINVPIDDSLHQFVGAFSNTIKMETLFANKQDNKLATEKMLSPDLSKLNLDDLLLLLYRLQQETMKNSARTSSSTMSTTSTSSSSGFIESKASSQMSSHHPLNSRNSHSSFAMHNEMPSYLQVNNRRQQQPLFTVSNLADVPKQLTTTLAQPLSSFHSQTQKHIHSPNDVVDKLLQTFNLHHNQKLFENKLQRYSPRYTYQQSQQHKAKLLSNLLSLKSIEKFPRHHHHSNSYH
ncbi:unnamed protein product [Rotaria socialis]|uniref:Uncharacterized protein n=1 Tax=Rotaria socialis TaxID=392032 RepID=A0A820VM93_9BILA|nr:unnamed protein product [Rotaria socialis]CAF3397871.1 unnamed protein product [Rotaria socialis]CAF3508477.1 unnamed protein product [Rotaria socialis]CAF3759382.1 unnamed protein product [Rotaria socialis]CAF4253935.1 unnamed protein product [Rotaria socialis]